MPDAVRVALERYAALDPLAVTWSEKTEAAEMGNRKLPADKLAMIVSYNTNVRQIAFRDGRIYVRSEGYGNPRFPLENTEFAFDGKVFYMGSPRQPQRKHAFLQKQLPQNKWSQARYFTPSYFRAAGIKLPSRIKELARAWHPQSELLALLAEGGQVEKTDRVTIEGRSLMRVQLSVKDESLLPPEISEKEKKLIPSVPDPRKTKPKVERKSYKRIAPVRHHDFYLDPEYGYAVRQHEIKDEAQHSAMRSDCSQFEQLAGRGIWLPRRCRLEEYTFEGMRDEETRIPIVFEAPLYVCSFQVKDFDLQPWPYERFELKYQEPGTKINDGTFPGVDTGSGVAYTIPPDPQQLDTVIATAKANYFARHEDAGTRNTTIKILFLVINGVGLSILVFYLIRCRLKKASSV